MIMIMKTIKIIIIIIIGVPYRCQYVVMMLRPDFDSIIVDIDIILFSFLGDSRLFIIFFYFIFSLSIVRAKIECNIIFSSISSLPELSEVSEWVHNSERLLGGWG
jgi:hypothetical protein